MGNKIESHPKSIKCVRCNVDLMYLGIRKFHEGADVGFIDHRLIKKQEYHLYMCPLCGILEFYIN